MKEAATKTIDSQKIYHNGIHNAVKSVIYELEPEIFELAKNIDEGVSVEIEVRLVDKKGKTVEVADPFKEVKTRKVKK